MKAIILCAGKGERLRPLTENVPKPMVPINGKPLLEYNILLCKKYGIKEIAINTSYLPEKIKEYFGDGSRFVVKIRYSFEPELMGTSGALNNFRDFLDETFVVIYGDNLTDIDLNKMNNYHKEKKAMATLALRKKPLDYKAGSLVFLDENMRVTEFIEKPSDEEANKKVKDFKLTNSGIYILEPEILKFIPEGFSDFAYDIFPKLIRGKKDLAGFMIDEYYFREVGKIEKYNAAKEEIESGKIKFDFLMDKTAFIDRDGVINEILYEPDGKLMSPATIEQVKIMDKVKEGIAEIKKLGFKIIVVTNQPGIAFGYLRKEKLDEINKFLKSNLDIDEIYSCVHGPKENCLCRKPKTGLIDMAKKDFNLDIKNSYMIGDNLNDIQFGINAGVKKTFRIGVVREDILELQHQKGIFPDFTFPNLLDVANKIKEMERS